MAVPVPGKRKLDAAFQVINKVRGELQTKARLHGIDTCEAELLRHAQEAMDHIEMFEFYLRTRDTTDRLNWKQSTPRRVE